MIAPAAALTASQRTVDAASAPRPQTSAPNSVFALRPAGNDLPPDAADAPPPAAPPAPSSTPWGAGGGAPGEADQSPRPREKTMSTSPPAAAGPRRDLQRVVASLLLEEGLSRADIAARLPELTSTQLSNALFNLNAVSRAERHTTTKGEVWRLTRIGREWLGARAETTDSKPLSGKRKPAKTEAKAKKPRKARAAHKSRPATKTRARKRRAARAVVPSTSRALSVPVDQIVVAEASFRCAVVSDGSFMVEKDGQKVELTCAEHRQMLHYLERMAEAPTRA